MNKAGLSSILIAVALVAVAVIAEAQQPKKVPRIGFLVAGPPFFLLDPHRSIPARAARARLR